MSMGMVRHHEKRKSHLLKKKLKPAERSRSWLGTGGSVLGVGGLKPRDPKRLKKGNIYRRMPRKGGVRVQDKVRTNR